MRISFDRLAAVGTVIAALTLPQAAQACGTIEGWVNVYWGEPGEYPADNEKEALFWITKCPYSYVSPNSDLILFPVVKDAFGRKDEIEVQENTYESWGDPTVMEMLQQIFSQYECLEGASGEPNYSDVRQQVGSPDCL